jgi:hypothetical protein
MLHRIYILYVFWCYQRMTMEPTYVTIILFVCPQVRMVLM